MNIKRHRWLRLIATVFTVIALVVIPASGIFAADNQDVTVTATPAYIAIANAPGTWTINGITGSSVMAISTTYYSNPLGDTTVPTATVVDGECQFTITNTSSIAIDLTVNFPDHTGGDASTNGSGTPAANAFAAWSYFSGETIASAVQADNSGSGVALDALGATTNVKWGLKYSSQTGAWTSGSAMSSTVNIAATAD